MDAWAPAVSFQSELSQRVSNRQSKGRGWQNVAQDLLLEVEFVGPQPGSSVHVPSGCSPLQWESRVAVTTNGPQASTIYCQTPYRKFANTASKAAFPHSSTQKVTWSGALRETDKATYS